MIIYLTGFMGSGKSTAGKQLAALLQFPFFDLDEELSKTCGMSVTEIFSEKGEPWFREQEHSLLRTLSASPNAVIATGGGTPCFYDNMDFMNSSGITVYLKLSASALQNRLTPNQQSRPLIARKNPGELLKFITELLEKREDFYRKASYTVKGTNLDVHKLADILKVKEVR
ncbi:MAG: AAA family ATPase [Bacteroidia bacterium]|nr:AAA family ATPase [Bacteroidia bacterium]